jgi:flagellar assembly protein FliH
MSDPSEGQGRRQPSAGAAPERWPLPKVEGPLAGRPREPQARAAAEARAREESARGYETGMARAQAQMQARLKELETGVAAIGAVLEHLTRPLRALDAEVEQELLQLALAVGAQLARRELRADPSQVIAILRQCLDQLPVGAREIRVHLHPEDAAVVRARLAAATAERAWDLVDDPTLARGGCLVRTDSSQVDARFESRVNAVIASALGNQRAGDRPAEGERADARSAAASDEQP